MSETENETANGTIKTTVHVGIDYRTLDLLATKRLLKRVQYAIVRIGTEGWVQGMDRKGYGDASGAGCMIGSCIFDEEITLVQHTQTIPWPSEFHQVVNERMGILRSDLDSVFRHLLNRSGIGWNDSPGRTVKDVLQVLVDFVGLLQTQCDKLSRADTAVRHAKHVQWENETNETITNEPEPQKKLDKTTANDIPF